MSLYFKRAFQEEVMSYGKSTVKDIWKICVVDNEDEKTIHRNTLEFDIAVATLVNERLSKEQNITPEQRAAIFSNQVRHFNYAAESFVDEQIVAGNFRIDNNIVYINPKQ
jgi:hypothetical protein